MITDSRLPFPWLVVGMNDGMTSFTVLCGCPTQELANQIAEFIGTRTRPAMTIRAGNFFAPAATAAEQAPAQPVTRAPKPRLTAVEGGAAQ